MGHVADDFGARLAGLCVAVGIELQALVQGGPRAGTDQVGGGEQKRVLVSGAGKRGAVDRTAGDFQHPVATLRRAARRVCRRGNIGAGRGRQRRDERAPAAALRDVAAIEQYVAPVGEARADGGQRAASTGEHGRVQAAAAQGQGAWLTVRDHVNRLPTAAGTGNLGDPAQTILMAPDHDDRGLARAVAEEGLRVRYALIDKDEGLRLGRIERPGVSARALGNGRLAANRRSIARGREQGCAQQPRQQCQRQ